jgi:5-methylcytosine-specific restriction protein A
MGHSAVNFKKGTRYSRPDVKEIAGIGRDAKGGDWDTGIVEYDNEYVIFTNVGTDGRTGHRYDNQWDGEYLRWSHKNGSRLSWPSVKKLLEPGRRVHVFFRMENREPFTYAGLAHAVEVTDTSPVEVLWGFDPGFTPA